MPDTTPAAPPKPDAVKMPLRTMPPRGYRNHRLHFLFDEAERIMGLDPAGGEKAHRRVQAVEAVYFFTPSARDTLKFPHNHYLAGKLRYNWVRQPNGYIYGYLTDDARAELEAEKADAQA